MGVSFRGRNHCSVDRGTAPKSDVIIVAAPQRKVAGTTWLLCASPGSSELLAWGRYEAQQSFRLRSRKETPMAKTTKSENAQRAHSPQLAAGLASELQL